ncbi:MAG: sodium:solute symporter [Verrucomicrobiae bacterium]|nr:sodium:solute symporter [Verrucomicrobiae bacterium]
MKSPIDSLVLFVYLIAVVGFGCWFAKRSKTTGEFMAAGGRLPGWAVGLSLFGTFLSSNTFIGNPGKAFDGNWNFFVFSLTLPIGAWIASKWFVPFYRNSGEISAYHHLEHRFGPWARIYTVICYLFTQVSRSGTIMLGVSIGMHAVTGWDIRLIILATGILVTLYTLVGGIEAVIWTDVIQSLVLSLGAIAVIAVLLLGDPGGSTLLETAAADDKFSLGSFAFDFTQSSFWVVLLFGIFINLTNFGIDQNYIQRYHTANSESAAKRSLWLGAITYVPVSAMFFLIGTLLFGFYHAHESEMSAIQTMADDVGKAGAYSDFALPHFMANHLPAGIGGLLVAALFAAAMSTIDTSLNSSATITLKDIFRHIGDGENEKAKMRVLHWSTVIWGVIGTSVAIILTYDSRNILQIWWDLSGVFAGAMLGLFLLGILSKKADNLAAIVGVIIGVFTIFWMSFAKADWMPESFRFPLASGMVTVIGTLTIFLVGLGVASLRSRVSRNPNPN